MGKLVQGQNDLYTWCQNNGANGQQLLSEWTGICDDGRHYSITEISKGASTKKFKWRCSKGHEWYTTPAHRTTEGFISKCPYCSGAKVSEDNNLYNWCLNNGDFGQRIIQEWTGKCNDGIQYDINKISYGSKKKVLWKCRENHEFYSVINNRTGNYSGCPFCQENKAAAKNGLLCWCQNNGDFGKQLLKEWTGICEDGNQYDINKVSVGSHRKMLWKCKNGHEWYASVCNRTSHKSSCYFCSKYRLKANENDLYTWCKNNGSFGQQVLSEWTGECIDDGLHYEITKLTFGSQKKMVWKCSHGHKWDTTIYCRTRDHSGCPYCSCRSTSYTEQFIYWSLKQIYPQTISRGKYKGVEFDITIPEERTCIEYSPTCWHNGKEEIDKYKEDLCNQHGVNFIYIREDTFNEFPEEWSKNYICFNMCRDYKTKEKDCIRLVNYLLNNLGHSIEEIDIYEVKQQAFEYSHGQIEKENTLAYCYPEILKEWHPTFNSLKPDQVTRSSSEVIYWKCTKCGYGSNGEWHVPIYARTNRKTGCPSCGYNWNDKKYNNYSKIKVIMDGRDVQSQLPELAIEWHPTLNEKNPTELTCGSRNKIYWQCQKCGYGLNGEWYISIATRTNGKTGCPRCGYNWHRAMTGQPQKLKFPYD